MVLNPAEEGVLFQVAQPAEPAQLTDDDGPDNFGPMLGFQDLPQGDEDNAQDYEFAFGAYPPWDLPTDKDEREKAMETALNAQPAGQDQGGVRNSPGCQPGADRLQSLLHGIRGDVPSAPVVVTWRGRKQWRGFRQAELL